MVRTTHNRWYNGIGDKIDANSTRTGLVAGMYDGSSHSISTIDAKIIVIGPELAENRRHIWLAHNSTDYSSKLAEFGVKITRRNMSSVKHNAQVNLYLWSVPFCDDRFYKSAAGVLVVDYRENPEGITGAVAYVQRAMELCGEVPIAIMLTYCDEVPPSLEKNLIAAGKKVPIFPIGGALGPEMLNPLRFLAANIYRNHGC